MEKPPALEYMLIHTWISHNASGWPGDWLECRVVAPDGSVSWPLSLEDGTAVRVPKGPGRLDVFIVDLLNRYGADGWSLMVGREDTERYILGRPKADSDRF